MKSTYGKTHIFLGAWLLFLLVFLATELKAEMWRHVHCVLYLMDIDSTLIGRPQLIVINGDTLVAHYATERASWSVDIEVPESTCISRMSAILVRTPGYQAPSYEPHVLQLDGVTEVQFIFEKTWQVEITSRPRGITVIGDARDRDNSSLVHFEGKTDCVSPVLKPTMLCTVGLDYALDRSISVRDIAMNQPPIVLDRTSLQRQFIEEAPRGTGMVGRILLSLNCDVDSVVVRVRYP